MIMHHGSILLHLFVILTVHYANGFSTFAGVFSSHLSTLRQQRHSFGCDVVLNAARRPAANTTDPTGTANPKLRGIRQRDVGQKKRTWMESYEALLEFKRLNQHCRVPFMYSLDRPLGSWVQTQRSKGRESMSSEQLKLLDKSGFDWESKAEREDRLWQELYQKLMDYKEVYGDCCVPKKYALDEALGNWVFNQRKNRKQGRLRVDREDYLDAIGFTWSVKNSPSHVNTTRKDLRWNETFDRLIEFREDWGHCSVPDYFEEDPSLGKWVTTQRSMFRSGQLRADREQRLQEIEFDFEPSNSDQNLEDRSWNLMFRRLVDYKATHGDTYVKERYEEFGLGMWVQTQRRTKSIMDEQRRKQLDAIGFQWSYHGWQERFEELCEYKTLHGTCRVKRKVNQRLADWVYQQRRLIKKGNMTPDRAKMLESIGFDSQI